MKSDLWDIIDTGPHDAEFNMQYDASLLVDADAFSRPVLHLYEWTSPSATFGHFIDPSLWIDMECAREKNLCLARRPTGGGIIFHIWDMAFSVLVPAHCPEFSLNTLDNYGFVNCAVLDAVRDFLKEQQPILSLIEEDGASLDAACRHFCMAKPTKYDVLWDGKKVAGASQRKTKKGFLHQGSISLVLPSQQFLEGILRPGTSVSQAMQMIACPLLGTSATVSEITAAKEKLKVLLATHLNTASLKYRP